MKRPTEKDPKILIALGIRLAEAKRTLSPEAYDAFKRRERELRHEASASPCNIYTAFRYVRCAQIAAVPETARRVGQIDAKRPVDLPPSSAPSG